ncbi:two-component system, OmpR family, sensor histidine kinase VicK [Chryseolinea serpens]|uniref:histidine kinase n=1 Tax=Chryseolinea serpens TaxID=947013 RepID=A0A1M5VNI8_9BACT|nr:PAS domain-containing sensor histidine kinase [Chryseolinea serpens]SHH76809.1 two-component system, OmpR family, sensor histidine kinase VicK [Chryseolinea serpens]
MVKRSAELLPVIEEIANIGCYETDMKTGTWIGTDNFIKLFGLEKKPRYSVEEFQALVHPDDFQWVMEYFSECLKNKIDFNCQYRCIKSSGEIIYVNSRSRIYYNSDGSPERVIGVKQDITASKQNEIKLHQLNENNKRKNEVLSMVAHDLNAPLNRLSGLAKIFQEGLETKYSELIALHEQICVSAKTIIAELIEIAELEDESYKLEKEHQDINKIILQSISTFKLNAEEKGVDIVTDFTARCEATFCASKIARVINNLLSNALKFSPENKNINIATLKNDKSVFIIIRDQGIGISREHLPFIFEKFSKKLRRPGTKGEQSTGLGLSIVKQIVDLHNGEIQVTSQENEGTTITIELPIFGNEI